MRIATEIEIRTPVMPNYLKGIPDSVRTSLDNAFDEVSIDVGSLTDDGIEDFITQWAFAFREHARSRRT